jgi:hypothetical protein
MVLHFLYQISSIYYNLSWIIYGRTISTVTFLTLERMRFQQHEEAIINKAIDAFNDSSFFLALSIVILPFRDIYVHFCSVLSFIHQVSYLPYPLSWEPEGNFCMFPYLLFYFNGFSRLIDLFVACKLLSLVSCIIYA